MIKPPLLFPLFSELSSLCLIRLDMIKADEYVCKAVIVQPDNIQRSVHFHFASFFFVWFKS